MGSVRLGVIGVGVQGSFYSDLLTGQGGFPGMPTPPKPKGIELGAVCDIDPAVKTKCAEKYPGIPFYEDWKELVTSGNVDAVVTPCPTISTPRSRSMPWTTGSTPWSTSPLGSIPSRCAR